MYVIVLGKSTCQKSVLCTKKIVHCWEKLIHCSTECYTKPREEHITKSHFGCILTKGTVKRRTAHVGARLKYIKYFVLACVKNL